MANLYLNANVFYILKKYLCKRHHTGYRAPCFKSIQSSFFFNPYMLYHFLNNVRIFKSKVTLSDVQYTYNLCKFSICIIIPNVCCFIRQVVDNFPCCSPALSSPFFLFYQHIWLCNCYIILTIYTHYVPHVMYALTMVLPPLVVMVTLVCTYTAQSIIIKLVLPPI